MVINQHHWTSKAKLDNRSRKVIIDLPEKSKSGRSSLLLPGSRSHSAVIEENPTTNLIVASSAIVDRKNT
jgi:hypothetical protein